MKLILTKRGKWLIGAGAAVLLTATPCFALFGVGEITVMRPEKGRFAPSIIAYRGGFEIGSPVPVFRCRDRPSYMGGESIMVSEPTISGQVPEKAVQDQLLRLVESPVFALSERLVRFLRFTVEATLSGKSGTLKEYSIGTEVYDRLDSFNPSDDSIVRSEARRLRTKLKEYYESFGKSDPVLICYQPGSYVPVFRHSSHRGANLEFPSSTSLASMRQDAATAAFNAIRILSVEDHPVFREGLRTIITSQPDMMLVAQARDGAQAMAEFRQHVPDITLMDLRLPGTNGMEALISIRNEFPGARIVILTTTDSDGEVQRAVRAGASGYVFKSAPEEELLGAIRLVHDGRRYIPPDVGARFAEQA